MLDFTSTISNNSIFNGWKSTKSYEYSYKLNIRKFNIHGNEVELYLPYNIDPIKVNGGFLFEDDRYNISCFDATEDELLEDIKENIYMMYMLYVLSNKDNLSDKALLLRNRLDNFVKSVK